MSIAACPSSDTDPSRAIDVLVISPRNSLFTSKLMSTCSPAKSTALTVPIFAYGYAAHAAVRRRAGFELFGAISFLMSLGALLLRY